MFLQEIQIELLEHLRQAFVKTHLGPELFKLLVGGPIHREVIEQAFHVREFVVVSLRLNQIGTAFPEFFPVDPKCGENNVILHVIGTQRLVVVVNKRNCVLQQGMLRG